MPWGAVMLPAESLLRIQQVPWSVLRECTASIGQRTLWFRLILFQRVRVTFVHSTLGTYGQIYSKANSFLTFLTKTMDYFFFWTIAMKRIPTYRYNTPRLVLKPKTSTYFTCPHLSSFKNEEPFLQYICILK